MNGMTDTDPIKLVYDYVIKEYIAHIVKDKILNCFDYPHAVFFYELASLLLQHSFVIKLLSVEE